MTQVSTHRKGFRSSTRHLHQMACMWLLGLAAWAVPAIAMAQVLNVDNNTPATNPCDNDTVPDDIYDDFKGHLDNVLSDAAGVIADIDAQIRNNVPDDQETPVTVEINVLDRESFAEEFASGTDDLPGNENKSENDLKEEARRLFDSYTAYAYTTDGQNSHGTQIIRIAVFCKDSLRTSTIDANADPAGENSIARTLIHELVHAKLYAMLILGVATGDLPFRDHDLNSDNDNLPADQGGDQEFFDEVNRLVDILDFHLGGDGSQGQGSDADGDGIPNPEDPAPLNPDRDGDSSPDAQDNCPDRPNPEQRDTDGAGLGDECDEDDDNDGLPDIDDACPREPEDADGYEDDDGCADPDNDGDGIPDAEDNCPTLANPDQMDQNSDGFGDACVRPSAEIAQDAELGANPIIGHQVEIDSGVDIGDNVSIGDGVWIMDQAWIEDGVTIEAGVVIGPYAFLGSGVTIGAESTLFGHAHIREDVVIGHDVSVGRRTVVGENVTVGDGAEIFDSAAIGMDCRIESDVYFGGSDIGPRCHLGVGAYVGHNTTLGADLVVEDSASIGNWVTGEDGVNIGPNRVVWDRVWLGADTTIAGVLPEMRLEHTIGYDVVIGSQSTVRAGTWLADGVEIGASTVVNEDVYIWAQAEIGDDVSLGAGCRVGAVEVDRGSTFGPGCQLWRGTRVGADNTFGSGVTLREDCEIRDGNTFGDDVYVGRGSSVGCGIVLQDGAWLESGSVVEGDCWPDNGGSG